MDQEPTYRVIRPRRRRRTLSLCVEGNGEVVLRVPWRTSTAAIKEFFSRKKPWILKKLHQVAVEQRDRIPKVFSAGEFFSYLGRRYALRIEENGLGAAPLRFVDTTFVLDRRCRERAKELFVEWYKEQARVLIHERVKHYAEQMQVHPDKERITSSERQWGGCSPRNTLTFSWRLVLAPMEAIDYVVVHELAHLKVRNHSSRFWATVEGVLPDFRVRRTWLRKSGHLLDL